MKKDLLPPALVAWTLRLALATAFLSAVADRFGLWGPPGGTDIAWGAWQPFVDYTGVLLVVIPKALIPAAAIMATVAEVVLGLWLLTGWKSRWAALGSTALLLSFAIAMVLSLGVKAPLNYSVFSAMAAAMALATRSES